MSVKSFFKKVFESTDAPPVKYQASWEVKSENILDQYIFTPDISFIPEDKLTDELKISAIQKMINVDTSEDILDIAEKYGVETTAKYTKEYGNYRDSYYEFTRLLSKLSTNLFKSQDYDTAISISNYLISIKNLTSVDFERLLKYYLRQGREDEIKILREIIETDILKQRQEKGNNTLWWKLKSNLPDAFSGVKSVINNMQDNLNKNISNDEIAEIYRNMGEVLIKDCQPIKSISCGILSYYYLYIDYHKSEMYDINRKRCLEDNWISNYIKKILKKTEYTHKQKELEKYLKELLLQYPNTDIKNIEERVEQICNK